MWLVWVLHHIRKIELHAHYLTIRFTLLSSKEILFTQVIQMNKLNYFLLPSTVVLLMVWIFVRENLWLPHVVKIKQSKFGIMKRKHLNYLGYSMKKPTALLSILLVYMYKKYIHSQTNLKYFHSQINLKYFHSQINLKINIFFHKLI